MEKTTPLSKKLDRRSFIRLVAVAGTAGACWQLGLFGSNNSWYAARRSVPIMGTVMNLTVYGPNRDHCEDALTRTIGTMQNLEGYLSRHQATSELARLNSSGSLENAGHDLLTVLQAAQELSRRTAGAFDVTMLPVLRLHENDRNHLPNQQQLTRARALIGYEKLTISDKTIALAAPGMAVSLDGIGKGYIVDQGVATLRDSGFHNVMVEAGGDLMVSGRKERKTPWRIGIRPPRPQSENKMVTVAVSDRAVATSGDYLQAFTPDFRHHHIIDPKSGYSPPELASCTVIAPNVMLADGLATALMVLGPKDGRELIEQMKDCEAYMVGKDLSHYQTSGFFS
jgi:thiamine biosynthesis lipoprotein